MQLPTRFDTCLELLTISPDNVLVSDADFRALLNPPEIIYETHIVEFRYELEEKILGAHNEQNKRDILIWFISKLMKSKNHNAPLPGPSAKDNISNAGNQRFTPPPYNPRDKNGPLILDPLFGRSKHLYTDEKIEYLLGCKTLYNLIFNEIQDCCVLYQIPFLEICKQLRFNVDSISLTPGIEQVKTINQTTTVPRKKQISESSLNPNPRFIRREIPRILQIFKEYFSEENFLVLSEILQKGSDAQNPLLFMGKSVQLLYSFRLLANNNIIFGCSKKELINWIIRNFYYISPDKQISSISYRYATNVLTSSDFIHKTPILGVKNGRVDKL